LAVLTATEGGSWNAENSYDRCILTVGLCQLCEAGQYSVSDLLGAVEERLPGGLYPMQAALDMSDATFHPNERGRWRFHFRDARGEVDRLQEQQQLFLLNSNGKKGTWDDESRRHAKTWAAAMVNVFENDDANRVQRDHLVPLLLRFALPFARRYVDGAPDDALGNAFISAYVSFAANNPTWANRYLQAAVQTSRAAVYSVDWLVDVLRSLTHGPKVQIYPHRYDAIRPVLERLYGVDLPDTAALLGDGIEQFMSPKEIQTILRDLGYDLGPYGPNGDGVDGVITRGGKTWQATAEFQRLHGIEEDDNDKLGWVGDDTALALREARESLSHINGGDRDSLGRLQRRAMAQVHINVARALDEWWATKGKGADA